MFDHKIVFKIARSTYTCFDVKSIIRIEASGSYSIIITIEGKEYVVI